MKHSNTRGLLAASTALGSIALPAVPARVRGLTSPVRNDVTDAKKILAEMKTAFEEFKADQTKALDDIKAKGSTDVLTTEKVDRINADISNLTAQLDAVNQALAAVRIGGGGGTERTAEAAEHASAFDRMFRKGDVAGNIRELEVNAKLTTSSDPDGGFLVPEETEAGIDRVLGVVSTIRSLARVINISGDTYKKLVNQGGASAGWVGEQTARPETDTPTLREIAIAAHELYANPAITQRALDDARIDIGAWLADEVSMEFAEQEGEAFATGNGVNKPRGILSYTNVANASYSWGNIGYVATAEAAAFPAASATVSPADCLINLYYALKSGYRNGASWLMSDATMGTVRKFKDADGSFVWAPPSAAADVATILQKPVYNDDNMSAVGAGAYPIAFGNFKRAYLIVDRSGIRVLRDPYTNKPNVHFYTTKRVGGGIVNFEAMKLLKVAAS